MSAAQSDDGAELLQRRLAVFLKLAFIVTTLTSILSFGIYRELRFTPATFFDQSKWVFLGILWLLSTRARSVRALHAIDTASVFGLTLLLGLGGRSVANTLAESFVLDEAIGAAPLGSLADSYASLIMILIGSLFLTTRAAIVPSKAKRTLILTAVFAAPLFLTPVIFEPSSTWALSFRSSMVLRTLIDVLIWWSVLVAICTTMSGVMYSLRREVREAQKLGQYTLIEKLGEGGMGAVYRASHARLRRATALKLLPPEKLSETSIARFESEVQLTAELTHPNTIRVFDYGRTEDDVFYYAMEFLDGATLEEVVRVGGPQNAARVTHILRQIAGALQEAHERGLLHRDIKPANLMLAKQGLDDDCVKVLDFGLVGQIDRGEDTGLSGGDRLIGTPLYMAPEAITDASSLSPRSDIYSLGAVAYFLVTSEQVFTGKNVVEICSHHLHSQPLPPTARGASISHELEALILSCLAKAPDQRPESAQAFLQALERCPLDEVWTPQSAAQWWERHRKVIEDQRSEAEPVSALSVTVAQPHAL